MGLSMFQVKKGLSLDGLSQVMQGSGVPGAAGDSSLAPKGSLYLDVANGSIFVKKTAGVGTDKWLRTQDSSDMSAAMQGISWREPVKVHDTTAYANLAAAETAMNTGTLDGQSIVANDRILFDNITGSTKNVFIVTGTPGSSATLVEDANTLTKGDTTYVNAGTDAGKTLNYNGTVWVQSQAASSTEIAYIKTFIGKSADGNETPNYSSNNIVVDGTSLETAIGALDDKVGDVPNRGLLIASSSVADNLVYLNDVIVNLNFKVEGYAPAGVETPFDPFYFYENNDVLSMEWTVTVQESSTPPVFPTKVQRLKVSVLHTGYDFDYNVSSVLSIGADIAGLQVSVAASATHIRLMVVATEALNVCVQRSRIERMFT